MPGVVIISTGSWYDPAEPNDPKSMCKHGNPNVLSPDIGTSKLGQGPAAHSCLAEIEIYDGPTQDITAFNPPEIIEKNLNEIEKNWPKNIPSGIIHADLFPDNIFFKKDRLSGIIDYYFSCYDFYAFEIAICLNALCFEGKNENLSFNVTKAKKFMEGYNEIRKISDEEKKSIKVLSQGAALRFLLTRVFDYINIVDGAVVKIKDPIEYLKRLEFHKNAKSFEDYLI